MPVPYSHSPITSRSPLTFPGGRRLAFYIGLNIEVFDPDRPVVAGGPAPDPQAYGWRDYGNRVGFWRLLDVLDDAGVPVSAILNSDAARAFPEIVEAGVERDWAWVAHGRTNSTYLSGMDGAQEAAHLDAMVADLDAALPSRPTGWLGPGLAATSATPHLLADRGFRYVLDWCCDDQPFAMDIPGLRSVPYSLELNDLNLFLPGPGPSGPDYERLVLDQFEQLLADSATTGRVLALPLHTFIAGQPHRAKYVARVIREIAATPEVWACTSDDVAAHARGGPRPGMIGGRVRFGAGGGLDPDGSADHGYLPDPVTGIASADCRTCSHGPPRRPARATRRTLLSRPDGCGTHSHHPHGRRTRRGRAAGPALWWGLATLAARV